MSASGWVCACVFSLSGLLGFRVAAQDVDCTTDLYGGEVNGNLNVATRCQLTGTHVLGNVKIFSGGSLVARGAQIFGNVEGNRGDFVNIVDSAIDGNIKLEEFVGDVSVIKGSYVGGNVSLKSNRSRLEIVNNSFNSNLQADDNFSLFPIDDSPGLLISENAFGGHLQCSGNLPPPTGVGNRVDGRATGQCEHLVSIIPPEPEPEPTPTPTSPPSPPTDPPPPAAEPPTTGSIPPPATPSTPEPTAERERVERGGLGGLDWSAALLLLPLFAWRRFPGRKKHDPKPVT